MMTILEYIQNWGPQNLLRYDAKIVGSLSISDESKRFLIEAGLPGNNDYYFPLYATDSTLPYIKSVCFNPARVPSRYRPLRLLGTRHPRSKYPMHYGICEEEAGTVYAIHDSVDSEIEIFFVNSSVQQYAEFMMHLEHTNAVSESGKGAGG